MMVQNMNRTCMWKTTRTPWSLALRTKARGSGVKSQSRVVYTASKLEDSTRSNGNGLGNPPLRAMLTYVTFSYVAAETTTDSV